MSVAREKEMGMEEGNKTGKEKYNRERTTKLKYKYLCSKRMRWGWRKQ